MTAITDFNLLVLLLLIPSITSAQDREDTYWSYLCQSYIYTFDTDNNRYKIYSRLDLESSVFGKYTSFQLAEGKLTKTGQSLYTLSSKDTEGEVEADFSESGVISLQSPKSGYAELRPCDEEASHQFVTDANRYFEECPKDVIQKCP